MSSDSKIWFNTIWIGQYVEFENSSSWKIVEKLEENETRYTKEEFEENKFYSESCSIFVCEEPVSLAQAVMKIRMQIPYIGAESESPDIRAQQAQADIRGQTLREIKALQGLTKARCSCTPGFKAWKHETQNRDDWVPGGFIDYILMTRLEGKTVSQELVRELDNEQQQRLRKAFKTSYMECLDCGFLNMDRGTRNLIWDEKNAQCYIVDWETWRRRKARHKWDDPTTAKMANSQGFIVLPNAVSERLIQNLASELDANISNTVPTARLEKYNEYQVSPLGYAVKDDFIKNSDKSQFASLFRFNAVPQHPASTNIGVFHETKADPSKLKTANEEEVYVTIAVTDLGQHNDDVLK
ncbi:uncharacterized protein KD926_004672 [Aspergillus affinis]|uniref:uncharacterized protein n=1 Tax=Aspergillus affinis TaxID=1070780 RepID=UPI0022FE51AA|nr:uncharacterized protein KD926_004672 [Aspergillus affinis]KAI9035056.1 hypothetical protein KD926_004672 [Aspergillus affinis]